MPNTIITITGRLGRLVTHLLDQVPMGSEERERLLHFTVFVLCSLCIMTGYCIYNIFHGDLLLASMIFLCATCQFFSWMLLCHLPLGLSVYRANGVVFAALLLYMLVIGGDGGSKSLWLFSFPLSALFLLRKNEGLAWSVAVIAAAVALLFVPVPGLHPYPYGRIFVARLVTVYLFVTAVSYWFAYCRKQCRQHMELHSMKLRAVLDTLPEPALLQDRNGKILYNRAFLAMTETTDEQALARHAEAFVGAPDALRMPLDKPGETGCALVMRRRNNLPPTQTPSMQPQIPVQANEQSQSDPAEKNPNPACAATVLLVDDDPMIREVGTLILENCGCRVLKAANGNEAIEQFRAHRHIIALVLCDQLMPLMDGWQTLAALREIDPAVPVIMVSGDRLDPPASASFPQPQGMLKKPFTMERLQQVIGQYVTDNRQES